MGSLATDTAAKSGKSVSTIKRDATGAKALRPDLDRVAGKSQDKGAAIFLAECATHLGFRQWLFSEPCSKGRRGVVS